MALQSPEDRSTEPGWTIELAEELLGSLQGVLSARVVARPGGEIQEIHLLTTEEVTPKQTVRNVESALRAHFHLEVDHRKISVARTSDPGAGKLPGSAAAQREGEEGGGRGEPRFLFVGHQVETERDRRVKVSVALQWEGEERTGDATGADLPRSRLEAAARATLTAIEEAVEEEGGGPGITLALDGVKVVEAFDRSYVLVGVSAIHKREIVSLAGSSAVEDTPERAVILATLQATDRWVRGRL